MLSCPGYFLYYCMYVGLKRIYWVSEMFAQCFASLFLGIKYALLPELMFGGNEAHDIARTNVSPFLHYFMAYDTAVDR